MPRWPSHSTAWWPAMLHLGLAIVLVSTVRSAASRKVLFIVSSLDSLGVVVHCGRLPLAFSTPHPQRADSGQMQRFPR